MFVSVISFIIIFIIVGHCVYPPWTFCLSPMDILSIPHRHFVTMDILSTL